jgi:hypothetical protein
MYSSRLSLVILLELKLTMDFAAMCHHEHDARPHNMNPQSTSTISLLVLVWSTISLVDNRLMSITMIYYIVLLYLPSFWQSCLWLLALGRRAVGRLASKDDDGSTTTSSVGRSVGRSVGQYYYRRSWAATHLHTHYNINKKTKHKQ